MTFVANHQVLSETDLHEVVDVLQTVAQEAKIVCLNGQMGSGKTTLVQYFCRAKNVVDEVTSPTFSLVQEYRTEPGEVIYHLDLYRLDEVVQLMEIGVEEILESDSWVFIEWPHLARNLLPPHFTWVDIEVISEGERKIVISRAG